MENPAPTPVPPNDQSRPMPFWQRWIRVKIDSQVTIYLSLLAIIVSCALSLWSLWLDNAQNVKQHNFDLTLVAFEVNAQATAAYQGQQQLNIQNTQIAMQSQMDDWYRQQALPFLSVRIPPEHVFVVQKVYAEPSSSAYIITGEGFLEMVLANNGGGKAGLLEVNWVNETQNNILLYSRLEQIGSLPVALPTTIDAQTPVRLQFALEASVPYEDDPNGRSDYQLGEYWRKELISKPNHLSILFSNNDPIEIKVKDIQLAMPETTYLPSPPSLFSVTNKTLLAVRCFETGKKEIPITIRYLTRNEEVQTVVNDGMCQSFPQGSYQITYSYSSSSETNQLSLQIEDQSTSTINLQTEISDLLKDQANIAAVLLTILTTLGFIFRGTFEQAVVELTINDGSFSRTQLLKKSVRMHRWGSTTSFQLRSGTVVMKVRKQLNNRYLVKIDGVGIHPVSSEVTVDKNDRIKVGSTRDGIIEILLRDPKDE